MEFPYQSTFLRSALVNDPFSLGDVGPEDVLRIESQFPYLFDSSNALQQGGDAKPAVVPTVHNKPVQVKVGSQKLKGSTTIVSKKSVGNRAKPTELSRYRQTQLPPNVFCFSREELKCMLEDVLRNNKVNNSNFVDGTVSAGAAGRGFQPSARRESTAVAKQPLVVTEHSKVFPYKGPQNMAARFALKEKSIVEKKIPALLDPPKITTQEFQRNGKLTRSMSFSTSGYLKKPFGPPMHRVKSASHAKKKTVTFARKLDKSEMEPTKEKAGVECMNMPAKDISAEVIEVSRGDLEDSSSESESKKNSQIYVKGHEKLLYARDDTEVSLDSLESEFLELKLATSLADKYEKIGLLKKHPFTHNEPFREDSRKLTHEKSTLASPRKKVLSKTKSSRRAFLEDLARELVYSEVLKHLQTTRVGKQAEDSVSSTSFTSRSKSNKSIQATIISHPDEVVEVRTPQLSYSNSSRKHESDVRQQEVPEKLSPPTPVTPDLSATGTGARASIRTPKKSPHENDVTDCSEISDFLASEVESKRSSFVEEKDDQEYLNESFATPSLTSTSKRSRVPKTKSREESKKSSVLEAVTPEKSSLASSANGNRSSAEIAENQKKSVKCVSKSISREGSKKSSIVEAVTPEKSSLTSSGNGNRSLVEIAENQKKSVKDSPTSQIDMSPPTKSQSYHSIRSKPATSDKGARVSFDIPLEFSFSELISEGEVLWDGNVLQESSKYKSPGEVSLSQCLSEGFSPARSMSVSISDVTNPSRAHSTGEVSLGEIL